MRRIPIALLLCMFVLSLPAAPAAHAAPATHAQSHTASAAFRRTAATSPSCANDPTFISNASTVAISATLALLGDGPALTILDVSNPSSPACRSRLALPPNSIVKAIEARGSYAYLALNNPNQTDVALQIVDFHDPDNPTLVGSFNGSNANDLAVVGKLVYLAASSALKIVDVSDPAAPVLASTYTQANPTAIQIVANRLYMMSTATYTFDILDLADPIHPARLGGFYQGTLGWASFSISGNRAYLLRFGGGVDVLDISSPNNPLLLGTYANIDLFDGRTHPSTNGFQVLDNRLYIADTQFRIYDVSSSTKATLIGAYDAPGAGRNMELVGQLAYTVNPESGLKTGDYGLEIIDISNQASPFLRGWFLNGSTGRFFYMQPIRR